MILKFHAEVQFVKGYNRYCIYDLSRKEYEFFPLSFVDKLIKLVDQTRESVLEELTIDEKEMFDYFLKQEYCFFVDEIFIDSFPSINLEWESPSLITNAILDNIKNADILLPLLERLNCKHLIIRIFSLSEIEQLFNKFRDNNFTFKSLDIFIYSDDRIFKKGFKLFKKRILQEINLISNIVLNYESKELRESFYEPDFVLDLNSYIEAKSYNLFFNRKIYISFDGLISNYFEIDKKIDFSSFEEIEENIDKINDLWFVNKDKIDVCRDCEFRYMCVDNRVPVKRFDEFENERYYYENECSYNPYISLWKKQDNFISLKEMGIYSNEKGFHLNKDVIDEMLEKIWNE